MLIGRPRSGDLARSGSIRVVLDTSFFIFLEISGTLVMDFLFMLGFELVWERYW